MKLETIQNALSSGYAQFIEKGKVFAAWRSRTITWENTTYYANKVGDFFRRNFKSIILPTLTQSRTFINTYRIEIVIFSAGLALGSIATRLLFPKKVVSRSVAHTPTTPKR